MIRYYLKLAFRSFKSSKLLFFGSIITVFLGVLSISLLFSYVNNELSMNKFHRHEKDIYMMVIRDSPESQWEGIESSGFFQFNYKKYPELENLVGLKKYKEGESKFTFKNLSFSPEGIVADSSFFKVFDFRLKVGNEKTVLSDPDAVVFSEQFARKMFGNENPIGKTVKFSANVERNYTVKGILETLPSNSSITFDYILPSHSEFYDIMGADFLLARKGFNKDAFIKKIENIGQKHSQFTTSKLSLIALNDVYFSENTSGFRSIFSRFGDHKSLYVIYFIIGILLVISVLNFANLQIIHVNTSVKKIGINRISGASGSHLFYQKITELLLIIGISSVLITIAYIVILPYFNKITGVELSPHFLSVFFINLAILVLLIVLALIYPTFLLSRIPITVSLKNQLSSGNKLIARQAIVTLQFTLSIILLIASIVVVKQLNLMLDKDLGFSSRNIIKTRLLRDTARGNPNKEEGKKFYEEKKKDFQYLKNELSKQSQIETFSQGYSPLEPHTITWKLRDSNKDYTTQNMLVVGPTYQNLFKLKLTEGRFFDVEKDKSRENKVVINEAARKFLGIKDISTQRLLNNYWESVKGFEIIGVVKDFNYEHLSVKPQPLVMVYWEDFDANFLIKFREGSTKNGLQFVQSLFKNFNPNESFQYSFITDEISALYQKEKRLSHIYILFTLIALLISANGLFTVALYDTHKRTKEIGIRKVNGATVIQILVLLNKDFVKWVTIAFVIATPIVYYAMNKWLENFAYKTELSWWIFALAGLVALVIALLTVSWQSWRAATSNPVEALRNE